MSPTTPARLPIQPKRSQSMEMQSRRGLLKNAAKAAAIATGSAMVAGKSEAKESAAKLEKNAYSCEPVADNATSATPLFSSAVSYGNLLFLAGVGAHFKGTVEEHTKHVLDELEKNLVGAGSSMEKVLKVNVYLNDTNDGAKITPFFPARGANAPQSA